MKQLKLGFYLLLILFIKYFGCKRHADQNHVIDTPTDYHEYKEAYEDIRNIEESGSDYQADYYYDEYDDVYYDYASGSGEEPMADSFR